MYIGWTLSSFLSMRPKLGGVHHFFSLYLSLEVRCHAHRDVFCTFLSGGMRRFKTIVSFCRVRMESSPLTHPYRLFVKRWPHLSLHVHVHINPLKFRKFWCCIVFFGMLRNEIKTPSLKVSLWGSNHGIEAECLRRFYRFDKFLSHSYSHH